MARKITVRSRRHSRSPLLVAVVLSSCGLTAAAGPGCSPAVPGVHLPSELRQSSGAVSPDGHFVALRTYESLHFYHMVADTLVPLSHGAVVLRPLREPQGEGVGIGRDGTVVLTTEGGPVCGPAGLALLHCRLPGS